MATVQAYTKAGVDAKFNSRSNMTLVHTGGGVPDISAFPDAKTGDVIERSGDGARWSVLARDINPIEGRVVSVAGKSGVVNLTHSDVGAAPSSHTHTKAQITDLNASATATANSIAQRDSNGRLVVATPTTATHAVTKEYVDSAVTDSKAWSNLTGKPSTFAPSAHTHTISQITDLNISSDPTANTVVRRTTTSNITTADPTATNHAATKKYVDDKVISGVSWANLTGKPSTFSPASHTHTLSDITDLNVSVDATANSISQRNSDGQLLVTTPTLADHAATKSYVDGRTGSPTWSAITGKPTTFPPEEHTHHISSIRGLTLGLPATPDTVPIRSATGTVATGIPSWPDHATPKSYVDSAITDAKKWANITGKPSTFTPSAHTHTVAQITDLNISYNATVDTVAMREASGRLKVGTPTLTDHATTKAYVDSAVTGAKAWANLTGVPSTFPASSHSHSTSEIVGLETLISNTQFQSSNIANSTATITGNSGDSGRVLSLSSLGRLTAVDPSSTTDVANKRYVDTAVSNGTTWANTSGKPTTFPPSSHTHTKAQITDLNASASATENSIAQRDSGGRLSVATPTSTTHATTKTYVDNAIIDAKKWSSLTDVPSTFTPSAHTHTVAQITDLNDSVDDIPNTLVRRTTTGHIKTKTPILGSHAVDKIYVDGKLPWYGTQKEYDGLATKDPDRLYIIAYF